MWGREIWGSGLITPDNVDTMDGKMVHSDAIWNAILESRDKSKTRWSVYAYTICNFREKKRKQACILTLFETIWNFRDFFKHKDAKWCILTASDTIWNFRDNFENKGAFWCILTAFETVWNRRSFCSTSVRLCDKVSRMLSKLLAHKLRHHVISRNVLQWIYSFQR